MHRTSTAAAGVALLALVTGCSGSSGSENATPPSASAGINGAKLPASALETSAAAEKPSKLSMPSIGFDKTVASLGLTDKGDINPPAGVVQWYNKSVSPGEKGISVIAGHVEYDGPDVFYKLDELDKGDVVTVAYGDGSKKRFKVYAEEAIDKNKLQTDSRVWGSSKTPVLALITCDSNSQVVDRHHVDNYVVWAKPV